MSASAKADPDSVLVTGAAGFIGSRLCERLAASGVHVHAVSRSFGTQLHGSISRIQGDFSDVDCAREILRRCKPMVVIHLAGLAAGAHDLELVLPTFQSNLVSTVNLLTAATELSRSGKAPRIVLAGSLEEPEEPGEVASSPYAISKWAASAYGRMFHELFKLPVAIARIFITYGPTNKDLHKLIPHLTLSLLDGRVPRLSSGLREVDWIHVDDVVDGLLALARSPQAVGETFDIGSGSRVSIRSIAERIAVLVDPERRVCPVFDPALDRPLEQVRVADPARTQAQIGWSPKIGLDEGLAQTVAWFRRQHARGKPRELYEP